MLVRQLTVDFNQVVEGSLIRANARRALVGDAFEVGMTIVVGNDGWGVVHGEVIEHDQP